MEMTCPCCSGQPFATCCEPILKGMQPAGTAEALMRSRYTAYVKADVAYLLQSTHPSQRKYYSAKDLLQWATGSQWLRLEILSTQKGQATDTEGKVEFKAYYVDNKAWSQTHHEYSTFKKEGGKWYFVEGELKS
jgi:SEC-C motif domain protein